MDVIINKKQKEKIKSTIIKLVEDLNVPLVSNIAVEITDDSIIYVFVVLKGFLPSTPKAKYESLIRNRINDYIGLKVTVLMFEKEYRDY
jgi:hypothetical protein